MTQMQPITASAVDRARLQTNAQAQLLELVGILRRRLAVIIGVIVLVTGLAFLYLMQITPMYTAEGVLLLDPRRSQVADVRAVVSGLPADNAVVRSEVEVIRSREMALRIVRERNLANTPEFNASLRPPTFSDRMWGLLPDEVLHLLFGAPGAPNPEVQEAALVRTFQSRLLVANDGRSYAIRISFTASDPQFAAEIVNAIQAAYLVSQLEARFEATKRANAWLNERVGELREQVRTAENAVQTYRDQNRLSEVRGATVTGQQFSEINTQLTLAQADRAQKEAALRQVQELLRNNQGGGVETATQVLSSTLINSLREQETQLVRREAELSNRFGDRHPQMVQVRAEMRDLRRKIEEEVRRIVRSMGNEVEVARARETTLRNRLNELQGSLSVASRAEVRLRELEREAATSRALLENFLARFKEVTVQEDLDQAEARVISSAARPLRPSYPRRTIFMASAMAVSLLLGVGMALVLDRLERGFRSTDDFLRVLDLPVLGVIPIEKGMAGGMAGMTKKQRRTGLSEAIRTFRTTLAGAAATPPKVVLVTSSVPAEGKSTLSLLLAETEALAGRRTLLLEGDVRRPSLRRVMNVQPVGEAITGVPELDELIGVDPNTGLHFIGTLPVKGNPSDFLASPAMGDLLAYLRKAFDMVVIDSPPVLAVSDPLALSRMVDAVAFLVRWEATPRAVAKEAVRLLRQNQAPLVGAVMTMVNARKYASYEYGGAYYSYGRYKAYYK